VRIGLIGPGNFAARVLVPAFARAGARLEVVGGGGGPSAEAMHRDLGFARVAPSAEALIADDGVDAVVVATRHGTHAELVTAALEAGKHVFCEKPLAVTRDELDSVLEVAARARGVLAVGFNRRFSPLLRELRDFVAVPGERVVASYRVSAGRLEPGHWVHDLAEGGGRVVGEVCHFVDTLRFLTGAPIELVHGLGYGAAGLPVQAHDRVAVNVAFADGSIASILYVGEGSPRLAKERLEVFSGDRSGILDDYRAIELLGPSRVRRSRARGAAKGHQEEVEAFLAAVASGEPPIALAELANVSLATLAVVESLRSGRPVGVAS